MHADQMSRKRALGFLAVVFVLSVILFPIALARNQPAVNNARISAVGPKIVDGHVYAAGGVTPVVGASVIVSVWNGTTLRQTLSATSDSTGFYSVSFGPDAWGVGNLIVVGASFGSNFGEGNVVADSSAAQTVDVVLGNVVPEFSMPAVLVVVMIGALFVAVGRRSSR